MKLTPKQTEALQKIADNPGRIVIHTNNSELSWDQRVHHTVSGNLHVKGLIEPYNPETGRSYDEENDGSDISPWYSGRYFWRLTDAGREALGIKPEAAPEPTPEPAKPEPFTFQYDALTGTLAAAALLEKAEAEHRAAKAHRLNASLDDKLTGYYAEQARLAENRAKVLEDAADAIRTPVRAALAEDMGRALDAAEEKPFHRTVKDAIGLTW